MTTNYIQKTANVKIAQSEILNTLKLSFLSVAYIDAALYDRLRVSQIVECNLVFFDSDKLQDGCEMTSIVVCVTKTTPRLRRT